MRASISFTIEDPSNPTGPPERQYVVSNKWTLREIQQVLALMHAVENRKVATDAEVLESCKESSNAKLPVPDLCNSAWWIKHYGQSPVPERSVSEPAIPVNVPPSDSAVLLLPATATAPAESDSSG